MPNGHGGIPRFGSPILLLLALLGYMALSRSVDSLWASAPGYLIGALFGWRLSWHIHLYDAMEYEGAYTSEEVKKRTKRRYRMGWLLYTTLTCLLIAWYKHGR
ncbi:MAG: hypothetical protein HYR55_09875 [Acidobacteria bacterium]|nr:hypothetical protein [Acidobacteriota bacterium]MBI3658718.1 hypothetical protein [Acidobacteriota bacterium]